jgi:hypothetical protein
MSVRRPLGATLVVLGTGAALTGVLGCAPAVDTIIRQPLVAGAVDQNTVTKPHHYAERSRGLPMGVMSDTAAITRLGDKDVCFDVTMHELDPIDMNTVHAKLDVPGHVVLDGAQLWPEQPVAHAYPGIVPTRVQTGYETYCSSTSYTGACVAWSTRPTYGVVMQPGEVNVYETRARMCFQNGGAVTPATATVRLDLTVPRPAKSFETSYNPGLGGWMWGPGDKRTVFRWGFSGAEGAKK